VPGAPVTESCNNTDDNCDGSIDNGAFTDIYETNNSCATVVTAGSMNTSGAAVTITPTLYASGDADYFRLDYVESDSSCGCCNLICTDEDYRMTITLTVPAGAGSYQLCGNGGSCSGFTNCTTVSAGASGSIQIGFDGACPGNDDGSAFVQITGQGAPAYECLPYTLRGSVAMACL
jgi:hypothetical protein